METSPDTSTKLDATLVGSRSVVADFQHAEFALAVIAGSLGWAFAMWVGISPDSVWGWVIAMGLAAGAPVATGILLPPRRDAADAALWESLTR